MADPTIALQVQTPNVLNTLSNVMNVAQGATNLQQSRLDLQERNNLRQLSSNLKSYQTQDGGLDLTRLVNDATKAAPKLGAQWAAQVASAHAEGIAVNQSLMNLSEQQRGSVGSLVLSVADKSFQTQEKIIDSAVQANPQLKTWGDVAKKHLKSSWDQGPDAAKQTAVMIAKGTVQVPTQNQLSTPNLVQSVNQQNNPTYKNINPMVDSGGIPSGPQLGSVTTAEGISAIARDDWKQTNEAATNASRDIGVLQNIKSYAKGALTGVSSDKAAYLSGLAGYLGISSAQLAKTDTDLLAKNEKMLALAGGDTNLSKTLAEGANPHTTMTPEAIQHAADQVIAQKRMPLIKQKILLPYINNPQAYHAVMTHFNEIADPRVLQFPTMSTEEKKQMISAMNPTERTRFRQQLEAHSQLGNIQ